MQKSLLLAILLTLKMCAIVDYITTEDNHTIMDYVAQYDQWKKDQGIVSSPSNTSDTYKF